MRSAWSRRAASLAASLTKACLAALVCLTLVAVIVPAQPVGAQTGFPNLSVYVGYADNVRANPFFPVPWNGSSNVTFEGCSASNCSFDGGAVRVTNSGTTAETISSFQIQFDAPGDTVPCIYSIWPTSVPIAPGASVIYAQTQSGASNSCTPSSGQMDSSDIGPNSTGWSGNCGQSGVVPQVSVTANGVTKTIADSSLILNTDGYDLASCPPNTNESHAWFQIYPPSNYTARTVMGTEQPSARQVKTCTRLPDPVNCASGNLFETENLLSVPGRGVPLSFALTYNSLMAAQNSPVGYGWTSNDAMNLSVDSTTGDVTINEENGSDLVFTPNGSGGYVAPSWAPATLTQNTDGTWSFFREQTQLHFLFSSSGQLLSTTDANGYVTTDAYNSAGQLTSVTDPEGRTLTFSYNANGLVSGVTDPMGRSVALAYDAAGNLTAITDAAGRTQSFTYDSAHNLLTNTDNRGDTYTNTYDASDRLLTQVDPLGLKTTFSYAGGTTTVTGPHGNVTEEQFSNGEPVVVVTGANSATPSTWRYSYDPLTLALTQIIDPNGNTTNFTNDASGNVTSVQDALGNSASATYNSLNEPLSVTDPLGITTTYSYDTNGNLLASTVTGAGGSPTETTTYTYGDSYPGDITAVTDPAGVVTDYAYDQNGDVSSVTTHPASGVSDTATYTYDADGEVVCAVSPNATAQGVTCPAAGGARVANTTTWTYNADGQVTALENPLGQTTTTAYNADGLVQSVTDPLGNVTATTYDTDDRPLTVTTGSGTSAAATTSSAYDLTVGSASCSASIAGATYCSSTTNPDNETTVTYYDAKDEPIATVSPISGTTTTAYDLAGNVAAVTSTAGTATNTYNADNELTGITYSAPASGFAAAPNVTYAYNADGERTQMTDGTGTSAYAYDSLGRLSSVTDGAGSAVSYGYNLDNQVTSLTYPGNDTVTQSYNGAGEESSVSDWLGHTTNFTYDANGNLTTSALPNGVSATTAYDAANQISSITDTSAQGSLASFGYTRNADGQVATTTTTGVPAPSANTYGYDPLGRLVSSASGAYSYDAASNLTATPTASLTDNANGTLSSSTTGSVTTSYAYDTQGNRLSATPTAGASATYTYNQADELTGYTRTGAFPASAMLSGGAAHSLVVRNDGTVWAFGENAMGQLGNGTTTGSTTPVEVSGLTGVTAVSGGLLSSDALKSDGTVWAFGDNTYGELGNGTTTNSDVPVQVSGLSNVTQIAAGGYHALALEANGTVWAWGDNSYGQLGNGTTASSDVPVQVSGLSNVVALAAGDFHSLALEANGTVWAWGDNNDGQLGNGTTTNSDVPVQVSGLSNVTQIAAGVYFSTALKSDGTVWSFGDNTYGQLGNGTTTSSSVPVEVTGLTGVTEIAAHLSSHAMAATATGAVSAWGDNHYGELGNGSTRNSSTPVAVSGVSATAIAAVGDSSLAAETSGSVLSWGDNRYGQLGNNSTRNSSTPVSVSSLGDVFAGADASYAYNGDGLRMAKTVDGQTTPFTWDLNAPSGTPQLLVGGSTDYIFGPEGLPLEQVSGTSVEYDLHDQLGSTRLVTDSSGNVVGTFTYSAYGTLVGETGTATTPFGFAGGYTDAESGLQYLINRYYDPVTGQFISVDPLVAQTGQPYAYTGDNPVNNTDPLGLITCPSWLPGCGTVTDIQNGVSAGAQAVGSFVYKYSGDIATVSSIAAAATIEIPGVGEVFGVVAVASGALSTERDIAVEHNLAAAVIDAAGTIAGAGSLGAEGLASLLTQAAHNATTLGPVAEFLAQDARSQEALSRFLNVYGAAISAGSFSVNQLLNAISKFSHGKICP